MGSAGPPGVSAAEVGAPGGKEESSAGGERGAGLVRGSQCFHLDGPGGFSPLLIRTRVHPSGAPPLRDLAEGLRSGGGGSALGPRAPRPARGFGCSGPRPGAGSVLAPPSLPVPEGRRGSGPLPPAVDALPQGREPREDP